jgi:hypothetical protein
MTKHFSESEFILNFGDSWAHGGDVERDQRYCYLLSCSLRKQLKDYSVSSSSAGNMILQLQEFLNNDYDPNHSYTALFFVTAQERQLLFDKQGRPVDLSPQSDSEYYLKYYNNRLGNFSLNNTLITLQAMCRRYKIDDYYLLGWQLPTLWHEVDVTKFYDHAQSNALNMMAGPDAPSLIDLMTQGHRCLVSPTNGHPSKEGHRMIYEHWLKWIQQPRPELDR